MRLFIAINFNNEVKERLQAIQNCIRKNDPKGKYSPLENLHLTLVFLGETAAEQISDIKDAIIQSVCSCKNLDSVFTLCFSKTGFFKRGGKELWYLAPNEQNNSGEKLLQELQSRLAAELAERKIFIDKRPYNAHITLGREIHSGLWPFETENVLIRPERISLMLSEHVRESSGKNKLVYTELFGCDIVKC